MNHLINADSGKNSFSPHYKGRQYQSCFKCEREFHETDLIFLEKRDGMLPGNESYCESCLSDNEFYNCPGNHEDDEIKCTTCNPLNK